MNRCGGYEAATEEEGPHEPQEMITGRPLPPAPLEHSDEEEGLEPWEVMLGHCEAAEGPYVLQEMITDEPPPSLEPAAAAEHGDEDLEPWKIEPEQETGARRYPEEMVPG